MDRVGEIFSPLSHLSLIHIYSVSYSVCIQLHAYHFFRVFPRNHTDGSDSAVCVNHSLAACKACQLLRLFVQYFCLYRVYLLDGFGGDPKAKTAEYIFNVSLAIRCV